MENEQIENQELSPNPEEEQEPQKPQIPEYVKEIESKNRQLWERTKKAEAGYKELESRLDEFEKRVQLTPSGASDTEVDKILEIKSATEGLDAKQIGYLRTLSKAKSISLTDARQDEDFGLWNGAYKQKVEKENIPLPSTTQGNAQENKTYKDLPIEEKRKIWEEMGLVTKKRIPGQP